MSARLLAAVIIANAAASNGALALQKTVPDILPGSTMVDAARIPTGAWERKLIRSANGADQVIGSVSQSIAATEIRGQPALIAITTITTQRGSGADTTILSTRGLVPISHRSLNPGRALDLNFDGRLVHGSITPAGGTANPIRQETAVPTFDSAVMDLVIAALPLQTGFAARIPIFILEQNGLVWLDVRVTAETRIQDADRTVHVFEVAARAPSGDTRYFIETTTREVVRTSFLSPDGTELRIIR